MLRWAIQLRLRAIPEEFVEQDCMKLMKERGEERRNEGVGVDPDPLSSVRVRITTLQKCEAVRISVS